MMIRSVMTFALALTALWLIETAIGMTSALIQAAAETNVPVSFSGGHEIGKNDYGRPVVLIAAALQVKPEVFREAFSGVKPARGGKPSPEEARKNKTALMKVLAPHGVTNARLDEVSNYYRYRPQRGELWPTTPAKAHAIVEDGKIKQIVVTDPGSGYSSPPVVKVEGFPGAEVKVRLHLDKELKKNGAIASIQLIPAK
jgi:hypothetical protein